MKFKRDGAWMHIRPGLSLTLVLVALVCLCAPAFRPKAGLPKLHKLENIVQAPAAQTATARQTAPRKAAALVSIDEIAGNYDWTGYDYFNSTTVSDKLSIAVKDYETGTIQVTFNESYIFGQTVTYVFEGTVDSSTGQISFLAGQEYQSPNFTVPLSFSTLIANANDFQEIYITNVITATFDNDKITFDEPLSGFGFQGVAEDGSIGWACLLFSNEWKKEGYVEPEPEPVPATAVTITPNMKTFSKETYNKADGTVQNCIRGTFSADNLDFPAAIYQESSTVSAHQTADFNNPMRWYAQHRLTIDAPTGYLIKKIYLLVELD